MDKDRSITNSDEDLQEMRMQTHRLNQHFDLSVLGESMREYPRRVLELIQLVEAQRDLLRAIVSQPPMQPVVVDEHGTVRFKPNAIVRYVLDHGGIDLNDLALLTFTQEDREHFAQLIGYSVTGYHELSYVSDASAKAASRLARAVLPGAGGCRDHGCPVHGGPLE